MSTLAKMWHFDENELCVQKFLTSLKILNQFENFKLGWKIQTKD